MIFSIFIGFCNHHHSQVENISSPSKETLSPLVVTPHILQLTPPIHCLLSVTMDLSLPDIWHV